MTDKLGTANGNQNTRSHGEMTPLNAQRQRHTGDSFTGTSRTTVSTRTSAHADAGLTPRPTPGARNHSRTRTRALIRTRTRTLTRISARINARAGTRTSISARVNSRFRARTRGRTRTLTGTAAIFTAALFLLTGCKSANSQGNNPSPLAPPAAPGVPSGSGSATPGPAGSADFSYGGTDNDSAHIASSACVVSGGDVVSFRTPVSGSAPALSGTKSGQSWTVSLTTAKRSATYTAHDASGVTTSDDGGVRSVSLDGVTLTSGSGSVTLSGTVLCGRAA